MNLDLLTATGTKPWLNIYCESITTPYVDAEKIETTDGSSFSGGFMTLHETLINPIPDNQDVVISAPVAQDGHLLVSSQTLGAQTVAYVSDIPPNVTDLIVSNDASTVAKCSDGSLFTVTTSGVDRVVVDANDITIRDPSMTDRIVVTGSGYTSLRAGVGVDNRIDLDGNSIYMSANGNIVMYVLGSSTRLWDPSQANVLKLDNIDMYVNDRVVCTSLYSMTLPTIITNTSIASSIIGAGVGTLTLPRIYDGSSYAINNSGVFRTNGAGRTLTFNILKNGVTLYSTGTMSLANIPAPTGYTVDVDMTFLTGTQMSVTFKMAYTTLTNMTGGFVKNAVVIFDPNVPTVLDCTFKWNTASANNTLTSNSFTLNKLF